MERTSIGIHSNERPHREAASDQKLNPQTNNKSKLVTKIKEITITQIATFRWSSSDMVTGVSINDSL